MKAKMKLNRLLSLLIALTMVLGMLPAMSLTAAATIRTHSVYIYDKDTDKRHSFDYYDETYYYTNGKESTGTLKENPDWNVHYDRKTATLELRNYDGGRIVANYSTWAYEKNYLTIKLIGENTITNNSKRVSGITSRQEYLHIIGSEGDNGTLKITNTDCSVGIYAEDVAIYGDLNVTVNVPILGGAFGIQSLGRFALTGDASCTVVCTNKIGDTETTAYGIDARKGITLSTGGELNIDVSQAGDYSYALVSHSADVIADNVITYVGGMILRYHKDGSYGGAIVPANLLDDLPDYYAININDTKGIATIRNGKSNKPRTVTVTNGTCDASGTSTGQFFEGDTVYITANEAPEGYRIKGWTSDDVDVPYISVLTTNFTMPDKDVAVSVEYAPLPYTVTFDANGHGTAPASQIVKNGEKATKPKALTAEGYTFCGWYKDAACTMPFDFKNTPITGDTTLYAKWLTGKFFTVTFKNVKSNFAPEFPPDPPDAQLIEQGGKAARPEPDPTAEGWLFVGWTANPNFGGLFDFDNETITEDITLYAEWAEPYYVNFEANGGTGTMDPVAVIPGDWCPIPECGFTAPEGKLFKGWAFSPDATEVVKFTSFEVSGGDKTLYAIWEDIKDVTYNLTTQVNGGNGTISESKTNLTEGTIEMVTFTPDKGYEIDTVTVNDVETSVYLDVLNIVMDADKTVIVTYKKITYTVSFNANGGSGTMEDVIVAYGSYALPENGFKAPAGKYFKGWATSADGTVISGTTYNITESTTFYAIWGDITYIDSVDVTVIKPVAGANPQDAVSNTENVSVIATEWYGYNDATYTKLSASDTFEAGKTYIVDVDLMIGGVEYQFTDNTTITINGSDTGDALIDDTEILIEKEFTATEAPTGYTVSGTATSFGSDTDEVMIQLTESGASEPSYEAVIHGNTASYSIAGVASGTYTMKVMKKNHATREYTVTVDADNVTQDVKIHLKGDIDGDGVVKMSDIAKINAHIKETKLLEGYAFACADVDGNGQVKMTDITRVNAHVKEISPLW